MTDLSDQVAIVTGGTSGIGLSTVRALHARGARVLVSARSQKPEITALTAEAGEDRIAFVASDVADPESGSILADAATSRFGRIDMVVHSAGGGVPGTIERLTTEQWMQAFDVHVHSVFHLFRACLPSLAERGGAMVLLSSVAGLRGCPNAVAYQTVKGALPQFARALARDHAHQDIRVNCVAPGVIRTPFHDAMTEDVRRNNIDNRIPLRREGSPDEVASLIGELLTNRYITGETFAIDGGLTMRIA